MINKKQGWYIIRLLMGIFFIHCAGFCLGKGYIIEWLICLAIGSFSIPLDYLEK